MESRLMPQNGNSIIWKRLLIDTFSLMVVIQLMSGIQATGLVVTFFAAIILAFLNLFLRPILLILTIPVNLLSLGLFTFVINGLLFLLTSSLVPGFDVLGLWSAIWGSIVFSIVRMITNSIVSEN